MNCALFLGGCRSGKSALALKWVEAAAPTRVFVATARSRVAADAAVETGAAYATDMAAEVARTVTAGTSGGFDAELSARIARHQRERGAGWVSLEPDPAQCPLDAVGALRQAKHLGGAALFDCVTLWLSDLVAAGCDDATVMRRVDALAEALPSFSIPVALVSNELGWGLVPESALGRRFRDLAGEANQRLAVACDRVTLVVAGLPVVLKSGFF